MTTKGKPSSKHRSPKELSTKKVKLAASLSVESTSWLAGGSDKQINLGFFVFPPQCEEIVYGPYHCEISILKRLDDLIMLSFDF